MTNESAIEQIKWYFEEDDGSGAEPITKEAVSLAIAALERDRWISVKYADESSLPEKEKCVIVCAFGTTVGEGWYYGFDGIHHVWKLAVSSGTYWDDEVVAWKPLPEPSKEET